MNSVETLPVEITARAQRELRYLMRKQTDAKPAVRIGVKNGGCSGMTYLLDFDYPAEEDIRFELDGLTCVINPAHRFYLEGTRIDYPDGLDARGFIFDNPNAATTCGCGTSFNTKAS
jgi:iron-sulfur cluster assembly protein